MPFPTKSANPGKPGRPPGTPNNRDVFQIPVTVHELHREQIDETPVGALFDSLARFASDPMGFVMWAFPWGEKGTSLEDETGPEQWQTEQLTRIGQRIRDNIEDGCVIEEDVSSGHGVGKLVSDDSLIPTPAGLRRHGDLVPSDTVFGADGAPTTVLQTHHFADVPMYRVTFDDRSHCDVSSGHLWAVRGRQERRRGLDTWRTLETVEILELGVKRPNGVALARQWEIPVQGAAQFEEREIDVHPYLVGVWLGDGTRKQPAWTKPHLEVADKVRLSGYEVNRMADGKAHRVQNVAHLFRGGVFDCGSHERYIPDEYKFNTVANRTALLEGLCDTDGEVHASGSIGYSTTSRRLAEDVVWLARSLGCKAMLQETVKQAYYPEDLSGLRVECRDCWRVTINAPFNPFTIEHRRTAYKPSEARYLKRWIESIEPLPDTTHGMCITVDRADGLYQANDFIVTHNSAIVSWMILWSIATHEDTRGVVTANTDTQLRTKTWAELGKWYQLFIARQLFKLTATALYIAEDATREKTWRIDQIPWSKERTEAFAGLHNKGKRILVIFDEAAAIDDGIYDVTEGALTDAGTQIIWLRYGNPTRTSGRFFKNCLVGNALVLTDGGWKPIAEVDANARVWDGVEWVTQKGAHLSGVRDTIQIFGVSMTPDHLVLTLEGWVHAQGCEGLDRADCRLPDGYEVPRVTPTRGVVGDPLRLRSAQSAPECRHQTVASGESAVLVRVQDQANDRGEEQNPRHDEAPRVRGVPDHARQMRQPKELKLEKLRRARDRCVLKVAGVVRELLGGHGGYVLAGAYAGTRKERRGVLERELSLGDAFQEREQQAEQRLVGNPRGIDDCRGRRTPLRRWVRDIAETFAGVATRRGSWSFGRLLARREEQEITHQTLGHAEGFDDRALGGAGVRYQRTCAEGAAEAGVADRQGPQPVYDLIDCGPRHRFVVAGSDGQALIVHNCTQGKRNTYTRVDSRSVRFSNKKQIQAWIDDYGEDSDFVRVRVRGMFPRAGYSNFISPELVLQARRRALPLAVYQPFQKVMAVDPARFGDDFSVITLRQGLKVHWQLALSGFDGPDLAGRIFELVRKEQGISCIAYDAVGNGADLDSALRRMPGLAVPLIPVMWGQPAKDSKQWFNQRSEAWGKMRDFLEHGQIPDDDILAEELISLDYGYSATFQIQLQSKKDIKRNGGKSPDRGDSLALSFIPELIDRRIVSAKALPTKRRTVVWSR